MNLLAGGEEPPQRPSRPRRPSTHLRPVMSDVDETIGLPVTELHSVKSLSNLHRDQGRNPARVGFCYPSSLQARNANST